MPLPSRDPGPTELNPRVAYRAVVLALGLLTAGLLAKQLVSLVLLITMAVIIALPLSACATFLARFRVPRPLGVLVGVIAGAGVVALLLIFLVPAFVSQVDSFTKQLPTTVNHFERTMDSTFGLRTGTVAKDVKSFVHRYTQHPDKLLGPLSSIGLSVATVLGALVVMLISAIYMAVSPEPLVGAVISLFAPRQRDEAREAMERIRVAWLGWLRGLAIDMIVLGGLLYLGMTIVGLPFAIGFAVFSALLTVIPNYGSVISAIPPIAFALTFSLHQAILVTIVYIVVNQVEGNLVLPLIMGRVVSQHPAVIAIGVLIVGALFGVLGLFISVPLISLALILVDELWVRRHGSGGARAAPVRPDAAPS